MIRTAVLATAAFVASASAYTVDFYAYSNNSGDTSGINNTATLAADASTFTVTLFNNSTSGVITNFYIESNSMFAGVSVGSIQNTAGVKFQEGGSPPSPGGIGDTAGGAWDNGSNGFRFKAKSPGPHNGINVGESLTIVFNHDGSFSLNALIAALNNNEIRMAQHFLSYGPKGESEWLRNNGSTVVIIPLPPAALAGLGMLGLLAGVRTARRTRGH